LSDLVSTGRWWLLSDAELVEMLVRVEDDDLSAAEAHALMLEHSTIQYGEKS
jgi:hypothetical protein